MRIRAKPRFSINRGFLYLKTGTQLKILNKNIFVTGPIQIGKSTVINKVLERYKNLKIGGFRTQPILDGHLRKGFIFQTFDGREQIFAHTDMKSQNIHDVYRFDLSVFEKLGVSTLRNALNNSELIVMDEIGQMEQNTVHFQKMIFACLDSHIYVLGSVQKRATWFLDTISKRNDTEIIVIDEKNRSKIPEYFYFN